jgi:PKD repeat protein
MKKSISALLLLATVTLASAQPYKFTRPYGAIQTDINRGYKIIPVQDGNFVVAGEWNGQGYLMKLNCKGDSMDRKTYTAVVGGNSVITDVLELPNGDLLVGGQCDHCVTGDTTGKVLLFQRDAGLNYKSSVGVKKFLPPVTGPLMTTGEALPNTKLAASGNGFYVLSITHCLSDDTPSFGCWNNEDSYVTKVDNSLNIQWHKLLDYKNQFIFHYERDPQILYTSGGLYVTRWGNHFLGGFTGQPDSSAVQKTDLNGNPLISKTFRGSIISTALNPAGTVLTCVGEIDTLAWLMHLDANTLNIIDNDTLSEPNRTQAAAVQYTSDGVTDSQGNTQTNTVTLADPPPITVSATVNQSTITVIAFGGAGALQYSLDGQNFQTNNVFPGLSDGTYTITVKDANGCTETETAIIITPPTASFSASPTTGCGPLTVQFTNTSSANAASFNWEFPGGNPATSILKNPTVIYSVPGAYPVTLTASNSAGSSATSQANYITVLPNPEASFVSTSDGTTFTFTNTSVYATAYLWDFGDGATSMEENPVHTFSGSPCSERLIILTATSNCGADADSLFIPHADPAPPTASFTYAAADLTVSFTSNSQFAQTYSWDFGDGSTSIEQNPVHTYASIGAYLVKLTVEEYCGILTDLVQQTVVLIVATSEPSWLDDFRLFPNPNKGIFSVEIEGESQSELSFALFNSTGQLMGRQSFDFHTGNLQHTFDFGSLPAGIYTLQMQSGAEAKYVRVVVNR